MNKTLLAIQEAENEKVADWLTKPKNDLDDIARSMEQLGMSSQYVQKLNKIYWEITYLQCQMTTKS